MGIVRRRRGQVPAEPREHVRPVPVASPLSSPEEATAVGFLAGALGEGDILDGFVINHWRKVVRATRGADPAPPEPTARPGRGAKAAGHRPGE